MNQRNFLLVPLAILLLLVTSQAQQHPNQARGFNANGVYSAFDIDNVNLFNGNLLVTIPIGGTHKVGGNLSYSLTLSYNSNLWTTQEISLGGGINYSYDMFSTLVSVGQVTVGFGRGNEWNLYYYAREPFFSSDDEAAGAADRAMNHDPGYTHQFPNPNANAGMGWELSLGRLIAPRDDPGSINVLTAETYRWMYQSPDGGEHVFYSKLHETDSARAGDEDIYTDPVSYTRDSTYLRMRLLNGDRYIDFPNGVSHRFHDFGTVAKPEWRLVRMEDQSGNYVTVEYTITRGTENKPIFEVWTINDSASPAHTLTITLDTFPGTDFQPVVQSVHGTGFNGQPVDYTFQYDARTINRAYPHPPDAAYQGTITAPFLTAVKQPDNSTYSMPLETSYDLDGSLSSRKTIGIMRGMRLPTGAELQWFYKPESGSQWDIPFHFYGYPRFSSGKNYARSSVGVRKRRLIANGQTYDWIYDPNPAMRQEDETCPPSNPSPNCAITEFQNTVYTPRGDKTVHHFSVYPFPLTPNGGRNEDDWHVADYGLPLTKNNPVMGQGGKHLFLSTEVYQKTSTGGYVKKRSTYVRYESDAIPANDGYGGILNTNRRVVAERTVYHDDDDKYADVYKSNFLVYGGTPQPDQFDGLGNYRRTDTEGNFEGENERSERTNYNPEAGIYCIDPATNAPCPNYSYNERLFNPDVPVSQLPVWLLGKYDQMTKREGGGNSREYYTFNSQGLITSKRIAKSAAGQGVNDLLITYTYDHGNLKTESYFGGDKHLITSATPEYRMVYEYSSGVLKSSKNAAANFYDFDADIDPSTGLVQVEREPSGLTTTYEYDAMNRVTKIQPSQMATTQISYSRWLPPDGSGRHPASAAVVVYKSLKIYDQESYDYDDMGRVGVERKRMPDGTLMARQTLYDGMGWKVSESEWGNFAKITTYSYDVFGRPVQIQPAEGGSHNKWIEYRGVRLVKTTTNVATTVASGAVTEESIIKWEYYDRQGRLRSVQEDLNHAGNSAITATYAYDIGNRLSMAQVGAQTRLFSYDNRGFLQSETHPELGNLAITYSNFDSQGNPGNKQDGNNFLRYSYDGLGRPSMVEERVGTQYRPLKEYLYYSDNSAGYSLSKLREATRHNYITNPYTGNPVDLTVTEQQQYQGLGGNLSAKTLTSSSGLNVRQTFTYDATGQLISQTYPQCMTGNCQSTAAPRSVVTNYANGEPTAVVGYTADNGITYNANGTIGAVTLLNGVKEVYAMDNNNRPRPKQITVTRGQAILWDSGMYNYDGEGNVKKAGGNWYLYDGAGRVVEGTSLDSPNLSERKKQRYFYDQFGNITATDTYNYVTPTSGTLASHLVMNVNAGTNRLNGVNYDSAGNLLGVGQNTTYGYDALNMLKTTPGRVYLYNANDERLWMVDTSVPGAANVVETITLRGLGNEVLREYQLRGGNNGPANWSWIQDYVYAGRRLLATESAGGRLYTHVDHLGSPRIITNAQGQTVSYHHYLPFGEEATAQPDGQRLKFTGHERDQPDGLGSHQLDYMHARYYSAANGKFLSVDPGRDFDPKRTQSWNLYAYVRNNPLNATDPTGGESIVSPFEFAANALTKINDLIGLKPFWEKLVPPAQAPKLPPGACDVGMGLAEARQQRNSIVSGLTLFTGAAVTEGAAVLAAGRDVEIVQRVMSLGELDATRKTGLVRGGRSGVHYVSESISEDAEIAKSTLALDQLPQVRVTMEVPRGRFGSPTTVYGQGQTGGAFERRATGKIRAKIIDVFYYPGNGMH